MAKQQTAVQWLANQLSINDRAKYNGLIEKAEQMEKEIIIKTHDHAMSFITGKEFFEHIFKNENQ